MTAPVVSSPALEEVLARARELIDQWRDEDCGTPTVKDFCRYAAALNDGEYIRRARALEADGRPVEAPDLFLAATMSWEDGPPEDELRPDGLAQRESPCTEGLAVRQVHGGQSVRLVRPPVAGTRITAARAVVSARHKRGRSGEFVLLGVRTRFLAPDGSELTSVDETIVVLDATGGDR
ncbi:MaoC family dehydratase N-terminal domain-containing protein [Streptomyces sp. NEAU-YJ-81]|uniref:MaoC family dehydratase N-terminal domain-containing protein n=1 Tax=Streptomyces sp. NEAU-YJ-81 TaxID=2820288 RepID=UPI001ABC803F|nr:MaoC family dehydratase N-terminal domain-containing protein [Streptomyces sp. NEAU-YJ-81]MBO3679641.1 MaoC family dehydratase N-terminal domain-containing protein [Streptomyces sp. NEAU-YJ-81]